MYITHTARNRYMSMRRCDEAKAQLELERIVATSSIRETDAEARILWRCPASLGGWRLVTHDQRVIWIGRGRPPERIWTPRQPVVTYQRGRTERAPR